VVLGGSTAGRGADWLVVPSIELKSQYLSNINNSPTIKQSDYILSAGPKVSLSYNTEITKLEGKLALLGLHYLHNSNLDRINQYYYINGNHKATPRLSMNLVSSYITDSTTQAELEASGTVIGRILRTSAMVNPGMSYLLTERLSTSIGYGFNMVDYQSRAYNNYKGQTINHGFDYLLNEKTTLLSRLTGQYYKYDSTSNTILSLGPQIGFTHKYEEKWDMTLLGGANISQVKANVGVLSADNPFGFRQVVQQSQTSTNVSPFFTVGTNYRWETGGVNLQYNRSQSANAYGNQSQYNTFSLNINQSISDRIRFNLVPYFNTSSISSTGSDYSSQYYGIRPGITYRLTEKTDIGAYYAFSYRSVTGSTSYSYPINDVWLTLNYSYPLHY
jgi:hypothetical protein